MTDDRMDFGDALDEAQARGFAEADPTLDLDGHDAAQKLKILAELAFNARIEANRVETEGIGKITLQDVEAGANWDTSSSTWPPLK